jgi:diguanylate cyclase (GGDEF)-like protein
VLAIAMVTIWSTAAAHVSAVHVPAHLPWLILAAGFAGTSKMVVRFEFHEHSEGLTFSDVPLLIGLVFVRPEQLLLAALIGTAVANALIERQPIIKQAFNAIVVSLAAGAAVVCYHALLGGSSPVSARGWLAAFITVPVADLIADTSVLAVISLSGAPPKRSTLAPMIGTWGLVAGINAILGMIAVSVIWANPWGLVLFLGLGIVFGAGYRAHSSLRRRHSDLERLYAVSQTLAELVEADDVMQEVLTEAQNLLRCEIAELTLTIPLGVIRHAANQGHQLVKATSSEMDSLHRLVVSTGRSVRASANGTDPSRVRALAERRFRDAMAAPVSSDDGTTGVLVVANRLGQNNTFEPEDLTLLEALATHASVVLRSCDLLDRVRQEAAEREHQALHDSLTGLANRTLFNSRLEASLEARSGQMIVAVMLMDLDGFKDVNDTLGHQTGDSLLQQIALALHKAVGMRGLVSRLGGDEFAIVIPGADDRSEVAAIAREILVAAERPVSIDGLALEVRASLGVALAPDHGTDAAGLLRQADVAMYQAKQSRSGVEVYDANEDHYTTRRLILVTELSRALQTSSVELHYQPKADLDTGRVVGAEALLRWTHPLYGVIPPDEFIPVAEQSGLIRPLTHWVLQTALGQVSSWRAQGLDLTIAVNLSARSVVDTELVVDVSDLITEAGIPPAALTLELTESALPPDRARSETVLTGLAALGVRLAIDDFGTGYSSLSRLKRLQVHEVKIDKSFVVQMVANDDDDAIVRSTIDLARNLGLTVVAEGVEDEATWRRLHQLGCDAAQGYYLSAPLSATDFQAWLEHRQPRRLSVVRPLRRGGTAVNQ